MPPLEPGTMHQRISSLDGQLLLGTSPSLKSPPPPMDSYPLEFSPTFDSSKEEREENDDIDSLASTHPPTDDEYEEENAPNNRHPSLIDLTAPEKEENSREKPSNPPKPHESFVSLRSSPIRENMSTSVASTLPPAVSGAKTKANRPKKKQNTQVSVATTIPLTENMAGKSKSNKENEKNREVLSVIKESNISRILSEKENSNINK